ncbi:hypothetical protein [Wolbachia endosymbiont of Ctenocephalides felis wCfeJ]|nr:hypothetical protein [Wolbachia endosymbiont of Ctenocephalides felis wCfeJ]
MSFQRVTLESSEKSGPSIKYWDDIISGYPDYAVCAQRLVCQKNMVVFL